MTDHELDKIHASDDSAFRCVECKSISTGPGARIGAGWACSPTCYENHAKGWQR